MSNDKFESEIDDWMGELGSDDDNPFGEDEEVSTAADSQEDSPSKPEGTEEAEETPIDQSAIDALMSGADDDTSDAEEDGQGLVDPDALDAAFDAAVSGDDDQAAPEPQDDEAPVDQDTIDALMAGDDDTESAEAATTDDDASMSQDELDALLAGDDSPEDQDTIDALMAGDDEATAKPQDDENAVSAEAAPTDGDASMSQDDLDALLNGADSDESESAEEDGMQIDQNEIDALFSGDDDDTPEEGGEEELDPLLADSLGTDTEKDPVSQDEMDELFAEGGDDEDANLFGSEPEQPEPESDIFDFAGDELSDGEDELASHEESAAPADSDETVIEEPKEKFKFTVPVWLSKVKDNRSMWTGLGVIVALLIGTGGYFSFFKSDEQPAILIPSTDMIAVDTTTSTEKQPIMADTTPLASLESVDIQIAMDPTADKVNINLAASAPEDQELDYLITSLPAEGILQGNPPELTYTPAPGFSGKDGFEYRTSDGRALSTVANVFIMGQAREAQLIPSEPKILEPRMPLVKAVDLTLKTVSTDSLKIDWRKVWEQANGSSFDRKVKVKVLGSPKHGKLTRLTRQSHAYAPDPYESGTDTLSYQFNLAGVQSKTKQLRIKVIQGDPPPALKLSPMDKGRYAVGDTVLIDAAATKDDAPESLTFSWQQLAGVPIRLEPMNQNGSMISFIVPSTFYTANYPKPVIKITVTDASGQTANEKITINAGHGNRAAKWNGLHEHELASLDTAEGILPWSY